MPGGGGEASAPVNGGEFLLQLLQNPPHHPPPQPQPQPPQPSQFHSHDPAVAALGPSLPIPLPLPPPWLRNHHHNSPPPFAPHNFFVQNPNPSGNQSSNFDSASPSGFIQALKQPQNVQFGYNSCSEDVRNIGVLGSNPKPSSAQQQEQKDLIFGSLSAHECVKNGSAGENLLISQVGKGKMRMPHPIEGREVNLGSTRRLNRVEVESRQNPVDFDREWHGNSNLFRVHERSGSKSTGAVNYNRQGHNGHSYGAAVPTPGFSGKHMSGGNRDYVNRRNFEQTGERGRNNTVATRYQAVKNERERERRFVFKNERNTGDSSDDRKVSDQLDCPGPVSGTNFHSVSASDIEESLMILHGEDGERGETMGIGMREKMRDDHKGQSDLDELEEQLADSLALEEESGEGSNDKKRHGTRDKVIYLQ